MALRAPNIFGGEGTIKKEDLVNEVRQDYDTRLEERRPLELQWMLNIAFINGQQYLDINPQANRLEEVERLHWWQERKVYNQVAPIIDTRMSMLQQLKPRLVCRPGPNNSDSNRSAAKINSAILTTITGDIQLQAKLADSVAWLEYTGTVVHKNSWDMSKGPNIPQIYSASRPAGNTMIQREGTLDFTVCSPQEILPDSIFHYDVARCRDIIHAKVFHVDEIFDSWGAKVEPEDTTALKMVKSMSGMGGGMGSYLLGFRISNSKLKDHAIVREKWEIPSRKYPLGRLIIVANRTLIYAGPMPYTLGEDDTPVLPFVRIQELRNPSCFFGRSVVERLIPLQQQYNALRNRKTEYLNRCALGVMVAEEDSIDPDEVEKDVGAPGALILHRQGTQAPHYLDNVSLPSAFETEQQAVLNELRTLGGVSDLNLMSTAPADVKSGVALNILEQQDQNRISAPMSAIQDGLIADAKQWLRLCKAYVKLPRMLSMYGKSNILPVDYWTGVDIETENMVVDIGSMMSESPAARRELVFTLLAKGLFIDPKSGRITEEGRAKIFELLELGDWENFDDVDQRHLEKADRENVRLFQAARIEPDTFDDDVLHISRHNRQRISEEYEEAVARDSMVAIAFEYHIQLHLQNMARQALSQGGLLLGNVAGQQQNAGNQQPALPAAPLTQ